MEQKSSNPFHNLFVNLTLKEKIALGLGLIIIIAFLIYIILMIANQSSNDNHDDNNNNNNPDSSVTTSTATNGQKVPVDTNYNEEHKYTLAEYLPTSDYSYKQTADGDYAAVEYWAAEENTAVEKGIVVSVDSCNNQENIDAANQFLESLPIDLTEYSIVFQTTDSGVPCD